MHGKNVLAAASCLLVLAAFAAARRGNPKPPYEVAGFDGQASVQQTLTIFPRDGASSAIPLPVRVGRPAFSPDGRSAYFPNWQPFEKLSEPAGLSKIEFKPLRISPVSGTVGFSVKSIAVSERRRKLVVSGGLKTSPENRCGVFEIPLDGGQMRQALSARCAYRFSWDYLSLSPDGQHAIATVGSNAAGSLHLEMLDLARGTTAKISDEFWMGVWSPDGKWIAAVGKNNRRLSLLDATDISKRRALGFNGGIPPSWSPDSKYLLLWKSSLFRCGFSLDVDPPATAEILDVRSGKRSAIPSSRCRLNFTATGWISRDAL